MYIYLDNCCYGRPYDDMSQAKIKNEAVAVGSAVHYCKDVGVKIIGSPVLTAELAKIPPTKPTRNLILNFYNTTISANIILDDIDYARARTLQLLGKLGTVDSQHLAAAEAAGVAILLTTDDDFIKYVAKNNLSTVKVINPMNFLTEVKK